MNDTQRSNAELLKQRIARRKMENRVATSLFFAGGAVAIFIVLAIFLFIFQESTPLFLDQDQRNEMSLYHDTENQDEFDRNASVFQVADNMLGQEVYQPVSEQPLFSLWPLAWGTFKITAVALAEGIVLSFFTAIAMSFYLPKKLSYTVKIITELLAGTPSVVLGFLGLMFFASYMQSITGSTFRLNVFLAGTMLSLTAIPIMTTLFEEIYSSYPKEQIRAAKCCGMYDYQVILHVVLPATYGKALAAILLGFGRCFGETMIVLMCSGNAAMLDASLATSARTFAATIGAEMAEVVVGDTHYSFLFFLGFLLVIATYIINYLSQKAIRKWTYE